MKPKRLDNKSKRPTTKKTILKKILKLHISKLRATQPLVVLFSVKQHQQIDHFMNLQKVMDTNIHMHTYICTKSSSPTTATQTNEIHYNLLVVIPVDLMIDVYLRIRSEKMDITDMCVCVHVITYKCTDTMYIFISNNGK